SAFLRVDLEFEASAEEPSHARHEPLAGPHASDQDYQVVGLPGKPVASPFELPIEIIEHDVGEQGRQGRSLRNPLSRGMELTVDPDAGPQVIADQPQQALVAHVTTETAHKHVEVHSIEELPQIEVDGDAMAGSDVTLYLLDRSLSWASRSIAEARFRKAGIEDRRQHLLDGLEDHAVQDRGNPQLPQSMAVRLGNQLLPKRRGLVG